MEGRVVPCLKEVGFAGNLFKVHRDVAVYLHASVLYSSRCHVSSAQAYLDS